MRFFREYNIIWAARGGGAYFTHSVPTDRPIINHRVVMEQKVIMVVVGEKLDDQV